MARMIQPPKRSVRIEITVPKAVLDVLMARERETNVYRTRIASNVLCNWASSETGKVVRAYNTFRS